MEEVLFTFLKDNATNGGGTIEKIVAFFVCWTFVKKGMKEHLTKIETGLDDLSKSIKTLADSLSQIERDHSRRLDELEKNVSELHKQ